jgi:hypothetical protein
MAACGAPFALGQSSAASLDYDAMAARIVAALKLRPGERVLMRIDPAYFAGIVEPLRRRIRAAKAKDLEPIRLDKTLAASALNTIDVFMHLPIGESGRALSEAESAALVQWLARGGSRRELHFHWSDGTRRPDGLTDKHPPAFDKLYQDALDIDYNALDAVQDRAIEILRLGTVRIHTPAGTDLMFRIGTRPFNKQNGDASGERAAKAQVRVDRHIELPAGVLRVAPVEESVAARIDIPEARFQEGSAKWLSLIIENGRITGETAKEGIDTVKTALAAGGEAASRFREFGLGFNPKLSAPGSDLIPYYGYGAGVVRLSLGDNEEIGGEVRGGFVRWFFIPDATLHVDFRYVVRDGKLTVS